MSTLNLPRCLCCGAALTRDGVDHYGRPYFGCSRKCRAVPISSGEDSK